MKKIQYESDRPLLRAEKGDIVEIEVTHFPRNIVKDNDIAKYGHIPNGIYRAVVIEPYKLKCDEYPELSGYYNYWRGDKRGCSDGIYANETGKTIKNYLEEVQNCGTKNNIKSMSIMRKKEYKNRNLEKWWNDVYD